MKKYITTFLCIVSVLALVACSKKADPITLPKTDVITSVDITVEENTINHTDKAWVNEVINNIANSEPTNKQSIQDVPRVKSYIKIEIQFETGSSILFAYEDSGKYYVEQPYQGIYKINSDVYNQLKEAK